MTGNIMLSFEKVVEKESPDKIVVFGDTNTTLAGALIAAKQKIPLAHIEAGIRSKPKDMPEEINRALTDRVSNYLFCASEKSAENLKGEGIVEGVYITGDIIYDLFLKMEPHFKHDLIKELGLEENNYAVVTLHRDYNVDREEVLSKILLDLSKINQQLRLVFPIHPRTKKRISQYGLEALLEGINVIDPVDYLHLMGLASKSQKVITDSGGFQKEAYYLGVPALVVMPDTGWLELVDEGCNTLCNENNLYQTAMEFKGKKAQNNIYGRGDAGKKIVRILKNN
jgi:UDP-N-acetylglucosamine 2-epimerase (non-hydrolysing)